MFASSTCFCTIVFSIDVHFLTGGSAFMHGLTKPTRPTTTGNLDTFSNHCARRGIAFLKPASRQSWNAGTKAVNMWMSAKLSATPFSQFFPWRCWLSTLQVSLISLTALACASGFTYVPKVVASIVLTLGITLEDAMATYCSISASAKAEPPKSTSDLGPVRIKCLEMAVESVRIS